MKHKAVDQTSRHNILKGIEGQVKVNCTKDVQFELLRIYEHCFLSVVSNLHMNKRSCCYIFAWAGWDSDFPCFCSSGDTVDKKIYPTQLSARTTVKYSLVYSGTLPYDHFVIIPPLLYALNELKFLSFP